MTLMELVYRYGATPGAAEMRAIDSMREIYGVRRVSFHEHDKTLRVEFDASRFKEAVVTSLLKRAGIDVQERLILA